MAITWITAADLSDPTSEYAQEAAEAASWLLYKLTAEKYAGVRTVTDWYGLPNTECSFCGLGDPAFDSLVGGYEVGTHGHFFVSPSLVPGRAARGVRLRGRPVLEITQLVSADGTVAPTGAYALVNSAYVVQTPNGIPCWNLATGITVTYTYGVYPPALGRYAAIRLGNELLSAVTDPSSCSLPDRVTSVTRQGISINVLDPQDFIRDGRTGIYEIDLFLNAANPHKATKRPRIFSPDIPRGERH